MNTQKIEIKERRNGFITKGFIYLFLSLISLFIALLPYIFTKLSENRIYFFLVGGVAFVACAILFVLHLFRECKPQNALVLTQRGFTDAINTGDYEVEWTNVSSVKLLGKKDAPYLGISLENTDIVIENLKNKHADVIRDNLEENLPAILIDQTEVRISLSELKDLFTKYVRESRTVENEVPQKNKNNPFSTDDVLRAFGKLPEDFETEVISAEKSEDTLITDKTDAQVEETASVTVNEDDEFYEALKEFTGPDVNPDPDNELVTDVSGSVVTEPDCSDNSLPEAGDIPELDIANMFIAVSSPATKNTDRQEDSTDSSTDGFVIEQSDSEEDIPDEIKDILSRAKSSKISELEKLLSGTEVPYSVSRQDIPSTADAAKESTDVTAIEETKTPETSSDTFEITLESMINDVLGKEDIRPNDNPPMITPDLTDDSTGEEEYPQIVILDDSEYSNDSESDDFIIPTI